MARTGRNEPCPCGSGKKYKRCCLERDQATASEHRLRLQQEHDPHVCSECGHHGFIAGTVAADEAPLLDEMSNRVGKLIRAGQLDEAERAAHALLVRFPDVHDGYDRLGMVFEARGESKKAADAYRKVIECARKHEREYDPAFIDTFVELVERLDPSSPP